VISRCTRYQIHLNWVGVHSLVACDDGEVLGYGLGNEDSVKRITIDEGQPVGDIRM
jgi:hypothetical protein